MLARPCMIGMEWLMVDNEPINVGRIRAVLGDVMKLKETATGVIKDAVQDDTHTPPMRFIEQLTQRRISTQERVDLIVVVRVVTVIGC